MVAAARTEEQRLRVILKSITHSYPLKTVKERILYLNNAIIYSGNTIDKTNFVLTCQECQSLNQVKIEPVFIQVMHSLLAIASFSYKN